MSPEFLNGGEGIVLIIMLEKIWEWSKQKVLMECFIVHKDSWKYAVMNKQLTNIALERTQKQYWAIIYLEIPSGTE